MRAIWRGHIQFSLVTIPIRIYNAIDSGQTISFNLLSKDEHNPVSYEKKDKVTGKTLKNDDIIKGYQYEPGQYVIIEAEDFEKVKLKSEKVIEIQGFVDAAEVSPTLFEAPYYIGPDGDVAAKTYGLLSETLRLSNKLAVGKVVLRDRETPLLLAPFEGAIVMYRLRYPNEVRSVQEVPQIKEVKADKEQLKLAKTLVDSMTVKFNDIEMKDHYTEKLKERPVLMLLKRSLWKRQREEQRRRKKQRKQKKPRSNQGQGEKQADHLVIIIHKQPFVNQFTAIIFAIEQIKK
jgi:DNA end-binding protein Ku